MKMRSIFPFAILFLFLSPHSNEATFSMEVRSDAFISFNTRFQEIYGTVNPTYQIEIGQTFCKCYQVWMNFDEFYRNGYVDDCGSTSLNIFTTSVGPKFIYPLCGCFDLYGGVGVAVAWSRVNNFSAGKEYNTSVGLALKSGLDYYFWQNFFIDLYCDYNYQPAFKNQTDIGGLKVGLGLGYAF